MTIPNASASTARTRRLWRSASLKVSFCAYVAVGLAVAAALSLATMFAYARFAQSVYDNAYGGVYDYIYDEATESLVPATVENIGTGDAFVPVLVPLEAAIGTPSPTKVHDIVTMLGPLTIYANASFQNGGYASAGELMWTPYDDATPTDADRANWQRFVDWMAVSPDDPTVRTYADALGGVPATVEEAHALFDAAFGASASPINYFPNSMYTSDDLRLRHGVWIACVWLIVVWFALCLGVATHRFYRTRLAKPLTALGAACDHITQRDLNFTVSYDRGDELGKLAESFEAMRASLAESQRTLWRTAEDRKRLNAAFAHDLRTPLAVLQGRIELLEQQAESGAVDREGVLASAATLAAQVQRLERYVDAMSDLQKLEDRTARREPVALAALVGEVEAIGSALVTSSREASDAPKASASPADATDDHTAHLSGGDAPAAIPANASTSDTPNASAEADAAHSSVSFRLVRDDSLSADDATLTFDRAIILEVAENLIANAVRHARGEVVATVAVRAATAPVLGEADASAATLPSEGREAKASILAATRNNALFELRVEDDGDGFSAEALARGTDPFFSESRDGAHFGLGLHIAAQLCTAHGGALALANRPQGGARTTATFRSA